MKDMAAAATAPDLVGLAEKSGTPLSEPPKTMTPVAPPELKGCAHEPPTCFEQLLSLFVAGGIVAFFGLILFALSHEAGRHEEIKRALNTTKNLLPATLVGQYVYGKFGGHEYQVFFGPDARVWQEGAPICGRFNHIAADGLHYLQGDRNRHTLVRFRCGPALKLVNVIEPVLLSYEALVEWPGACLGGSGKYVEPGTGFNVFRPHVPEPTPPPPAPACLEGDELAKFINSQARPISTSDDYRLYIDSRDSMLYYGRDTTHITYGRSLRDNDNDYTNVKTAGDRCPDIKNHYALYTHEVHLERGDKFELVSVTTPTNACHKVARVTVPNLCEPLVWSIIQ